MHVSFLRRKLAKLNELILTFFANQQVSTQRVGGPRLPLCHSVLLANSDSPMDGVKRGHSGGGQLNSGNSTPDFWRATLRMYLSKYLFFNQSKYVLVRPEIGSMQDVDDESQLRYLPEGLKGG